MHILDPMAIRKSERIGAKPKVDYSKMGGTAGTQTSTSTPTGKTTKSKGDKSNANAKPEIPQVSRSSGLEDLNKATLPHPATKLRCLNALTKKTKKLGSCKVQIEEGRVIEIPFFSGMVKPIL